MAMLNGKLSRKGGDIVHVITYFTGLSTRYAHQTRGKGETGRKIA